jgi:glycosyltransferase involved in cell wall biosynthesis
MRILHLNFDDSIGGASRAAIRLHKALLLKKVISRIIIIKQNNNEKEVFKFKNNYDLLNFLKRGFSYILKNIQNFQKLDIHRSYNIFNNQQLVKYINNSNYDLVHLHWINSEMISIKDLIKINKKIVWTFHDLWPVLPTQHITLKNNVNFSVNSRFENFFYNRKKNLFKKQKINIICPSNFIYKKIKNSKIIKKNRLEIISNTLDKNFWKPINKDFCRKKLGIKKNKKIILFHLPRKSDDYVKGLDIFKFVIKNLKIHNVEIIILGKQRQNITSNFKYKVHSYGDIYSKSKLRLLYNSSDLVLSTSRFESFGQVILEAQFCGVPCIGFENTGLKEIIINNKTGILIDINNKKQMIEKVEHLLSEKKIFVIKKKYLNQIINKFDNQKISADHIQMYKKIINEE